MTTLPDVPFNRDSAAPIDARPFEHVAVIGAGAWGTALAITAARAGRQVRLWARRGAIANDINLHRRNAAYLAELDLPEALVATTDLEVATASAEAVLLVTPSTTVRPMSRELAKILRPDIPVIVCAKGIEDGTGLLMTDVAGEELPDRDIGVLSGPTFADETAKGFPTAVTVASEFREEDSRSLGEMLATRVAVSMSTETFRPFISDDVVGVEVGGAVKNVLAIMCGIAWGCGFASNTRAALITRGLDEMKALADALGGRRETVTGLSGIGDLMLTCSSIQSRNMRYGVQLGQRIPKERMFNGRPMVVEGVANAISVTNLARKRGVEMPICEAVRAIVHDGADVGQTFGAHWGRPLQAEPRALAFELEHPAGEDAADKVAELMEQAILMR